MIAIIYQIVAHYRYPIFKELCNSKEYKFIIISGTTRKGNIKTVDPNKANLPLNKGGLNWEFVKNIWLFKNRLLWQSGLLKKCLKNKFTAYIFLGDVSYISTWICAFLLRQKGKKVYFWTHGVYKKEEGIKGHIRKAFYKLANGIFLYGNYAAQIMANQNFSNSVLHVIYNSLDYYAQLKLRDSISDYILKKNNSKYFKDYSHPQIIFIGRLTKQKKILQLIEAAKILKEDRFIINILLVGEGEEEKNIKKLASSYKLAKNVFFYGPSYNEFDNYKLIAGSDICVSPGEVGLTAIYSLGYGTPVITHNNFSKQMPEFESIKPGITGDFFEMDNIQELSMKIKEWIINNTDRKKTRLACYKIIDEKYNPAYQHEIICEVLKNDKIIKDNQSF